jgi:hypothetical protein
MAKTQQSFFTDEQIDQLSRAVTEIGLAVTPRGNGGHDASGGFVLSLTEAVMGVTAGLCKIADAITELGEAVRESTNNDDRS